MRLQSVLDPARAGFDAVIDVRSPSEFAADHLPGAISLPVLSDAERAEVGTLHKTAPFEARKRGAGLIAANVARHLAGPLADLGGGWRPLLYCWRGGMRSGSMAHILREVGWRAEVVEGGYKAWRRLVVARVSEAPFPAPMIVLDGDTGSGKTAILAALAARGTQVIDLEALANHRGSLFGAMPGGQPSQALFEGRLAAAVEALDPARPVVVEAESSRVGDRTVPASVWAALRDAPRMRVEVPRPERARFTAATYAEISADPAALAEVLDRLAPLHPRERLAQWRAQAASGDFAALAEGLMADHYDPRYRAHRARFAEREGATIAVPRLDAAGIAQAAARIEATLPQLLSDPNIPG